MNALLLTDEENAFEILGEDAGWYGDNGGDPDGNTWLPMPSNEISDILMQSVVSAGYGCVVEMEEATDEEIAALFEITPSEESDEYEADELKSKADEKLQWAHYGAYNAMDSIWVYVK